MGKINSRAKGCIGERQWRDFLKERGIEARRGAQYHGGGDSPDVVADTPGWHCEVKRVEKCNLYEAMEQAIRDSQPKNLLPYVAHRRNHKPWIVATLADSWVNLILLQKEAERLTGISVQSSGFVGLLHALKMLNVPDQTGAQSVRTPESVPEGPVDAAKGSGSVTGPVNGV